MKDVDELIEKYSNISDGAVFTGPKTVSLTARVFVETQIQLETLARLLGRKRTPLLAEIVTASVNEIFGKMRFPEELFAEYEEKMRDEGLLE